MTAPQNVLARWVRWAGGAMALVGLVIGAGVLILALGGKFSRKVPEIAAPSRPQPAAEKFGPVATARRVPLPRFESAVGTIRAVHETSIGSKLLARVVEVSLKAGQKVRAGDVLVRLDDTDLRAKLEQANAAVASAEAVRGQAVAEEKRYAQLVRSRTISRQQYDSVVATLRSAEADLSRVRAAVGEVQAMLDWATVRSPIDGTVIDKKVDAGDMVTPGQLLVTLYDPKQMQLVASVRESLTRQLQIGQQIGVRVEGLHRQCGGTVSEIVPEAQSASRTFQVKVTGPCPTGVYSGMFGRILIPLGEESVLAIPREAVQDVGQLTLVEVLENGRPSRRAIRVGRTFGDEPDVPAELRGCVEVLSGLREGEQVLLPEAGGFQPAGS